MESSPLTLAHDHARAASVATSSSDTTVAINEHALAAGEFAKAASGTGSAEAMRTLRLLEHHHQRLSELLRYPSENPPTTTSTEPEVQLLAEKPLSTSAAVAELRASKSDIGTRSSSPLRNPPSLQHPRRLPPRDLSSSIASNLASARGIRKDYTRLPLSPSVSSHQAPGSLEAHPRRDGKRTKFPGSIPEHSPAQPSWVPPTHTSPPKANSQTSTSRATAVAEHAAANTNAADENFSRFYSTVGSLLNRLSAPLAFAGLPLAAEESKEPVERDPARRKTSNSTDNLRQEPDLSKYISRAALRATTRDGHSANDSFYVVPTAGHTMSYAQILSFDQKEKRRLQASMHSENPELFADQYEDDDFEDARETPMPNSTAFIKKSSIRRAGSSKQLENRVEELLTENQSMKEIVDRLSKRLSAFEMGAQKSSMALQESIRLFRSSSPAREQHPNQNSDEALRRKVMDLEEQVSFGGQEIERLAKDNEKLKMVVTRYRDRWEKLKEGAKTRREGSSGKDGKDSLAKKDNESGSGRFLAG